MNNSNISYIDIDILSETFNIGAYKPANTLNGLVYQGIELSISNAKEVDSADSHNTLNFKVEECITRISLPITSIVRGHEQLVFREDYSDDFESLFTPNNVLIERLTAPPRTIDDLDIIGLNQRPTSIFIQSVMVLAHQTSYNESEVKILAVPTCVSNL